MPAFIHDRAQHLLAKNPKMTKSQAFAIATQQSHALGKSPKGYGTAEGKQRAKQKFDKPKKQYVKTPNPGGLETPKLKTREKRAMDYVMLAAMRDELLAIEKDASARSLGLQLLNAFGVRSLGHAPGDAVKTTGRAIARGMDKQMAGGRDFGGVAKIRQARMAPAPRMPQLRQAAHNLAPSGLELNTSGQWLSKMAYAALTPAGRLRRAQSVGRAPGAMERSTPSVADQVKPKGSGFGQSLPGANQGGKS